MNLTEKLIRLRKKNSLTQLELAEKMDVTRQAISRWELGEALPSTDNLRRLSELFNVPVDYLMNDNASEPGTAVAVMEEPKVEKRGWKLVLILTVAILILLAFSVGLVVGLKKNDEKPTKVPFNSLQADAVNEEEVKETFDLNPLFPPHAYTEVLSEGNFEDSME